MGPNTEYRAMARRLIPHYDGGNGRTMGDWILHGVFASLREAENALSGCRARGEQTRIVEALLARDAHSDPR